MVLNCRWEDFMRTVMHMVLAAGYVYSGFENKSYTHVQHGGLIDRYIGPTNNNNNKKQKMREEKCQEAYYNQLHLLSNPGPKVF